MVFYLLLTMYSMDTDDRFYLFECFFCDIMVLCTSIWLGLEYITCPEQAVVWFADAAREDDHDHGQGFMVVNATDRYLQAERWPHATTDSGDAQIRQNIPCATI